MKKLHLGCGKRFIPGFVHVDVDAHPHVDHVGDIRDLGEFAEGCAELIYCCHCFNFFDDEEAPAVLAEWRRVLAPGGILRLSVPDFDAACRAYLFFEKIQPVQRLVNGYYKTESGAIYYRTLYDERTLGQLLLRCGFENPHRYDWRATEHAGVDDYAQAYLPHMDKEKGLLMSLNMEAGKP